MTERQHTLTERPLVIEIRSPAVDERSGVTPDGRSWSMRQQTGFVDEVDAPGQKFPVRLPDGHAGYAAGRYLLAVGALDQYKGNWRINAFSGLRLVRLDEALKALSSLPGKSSSS